MGHLDSANWEKYYPKDLIINPTPEILAANSASDKNNFTVVVPNLKIDSTYSFQFQYVFEDGVKSDWSPGKFVNTSTETVPAAVTATVPATAIGNIPVTLSAFPANTKRVDIYIIGGVYGAGKVADSFFQAGTKNIPVAAGVYQVSLIAVTPSGINGNPTNTFTITISDIVTEDITAPDPIVSGIVTGGVHPQDSSGQLGYLNVAVTNATIPADFAGYIVKIVSSTNTWTQTFNSSTALSNLYITGGLFVGQSYTLSVATTDGKNISSYVNCTPAPFTITDTRTNTSTVTGNLSFSATDSILTVSWVASTDPYVDSYRVQVTSNADTTFASPLQTVESKGTTATFGGLTSNTTYRVRVTARYSGAAGALSTNHTTGTFTLNSSGAISDGVAPTANPLITDSMVKSLFGAFAITFPPITNPDDVKYEVFIKDTNATGIVDEQYKVLEVGGTFAVIKTLANRTTLLSYGTDYYIAVRAKDNDGVSTAAVTAVGPVQTLQVANADLAADSVYANNIKAGEIDATKLVSDVVLASQKITVGSNTALDRVRLDATNATINGQAVSSRIYIGGGNYYDTASPFYADNLGRLSIGQKLKFENGELTINGKGTFTGTVTAGSGLNSVSLGNDVSGTNDGIYIGATGDYIYADGTLRLGNGNITYSNGTLAVQGNITANAIAANTSLSGLSITGTTGVFGGSLSVGTATMTNITNAVSVTEFNPNTGTNVTRVRFTANNALRIGDVVVISGIAQNQTLISSGPPPVYSYSNNPFNLGTVTVYASTTTTFDIQSSVNGTYTSGGIATAPAFKVTSTGILTAAAGQIGGWDINATQFRSNGPNYISLNPLTPKIALVTGATLNSLTGIYQGGTEAITIDPIQGIKDSAGNFSLTTTGILTLRGSITSGSVITGAIIQASGSTFVKIDGVSYPGTIQLYAAGYATPGFIDVSGSWPTNEFSQGEISISPPIATGDSAPKFLMKSDAQGGYTLLSSQAIILGDSSSTTSSVVIYSGEGGSIIEATTSSGIAINQRSLRNMSAWQGSGPPSGPTFNSSQIGDIVLFYT